VVNKNVFITENLNCTMIWKHKMRNDRIGVLNDDDDAYYYYYFF